MSDEQIRKREDRCMYAAIVFYAVTVALGLGGFVLAVFGRTLPATFMGAGAFVAAILCVLTARASIRWRHMRVPEY